MFEMVRNPPVMGGRGVTGLSHDGIDMSREIRLGIEGGYGGREPPIGRSPFVPEARPEACCVSEANLLRRAHSPRRGRASREFF